MLVGNCGVSGQIESEVRRVAARQRIGSLDFRQARILATVLREGSASRAAERLKLSQPAVSVVLRRLRRAFADPLLVRAAHGLVPTERGRALLPLLERLVDAFEDLERAGQGFEPATSTRLFRLASPSYLAPLLVPALAAALRREAPGVDLEARAMWPGFDYVAALGANELDFVVANWPEAPEHLKGVTLLDDALVCLLPDGHPLAGPEPLPLAAYLGLDHVSPTPPSAARSSPVDGALARLGLRRRIRIVVPDYTIPPSIVAESGLVCTTGARFLPLARRIAPIAVAPAPVELGTIRFRLLWHERVHADPAHRWLRGRLRALAAELPEPELFDDAAALGGGPVLGLGLARRG